MIRRPPRSTLSSSSAASDVYKRQVQDIARPQPRGGTTQLGTHTHTHTHLLACFQLPISVTRPPTGGSEFSLYVQLQASMMDVMQSHGMPVITDRWSWPGLGKSKGFHSSPEYTSRCLGLCQWRLFILRFTGTLYPHRCTQKSTPARKMDNSQMLIRLITNIPRPPMKDVPCSRSP